MLTPPRRTRARFWLLGLRLDPAYRPWVYEQVIRPGHLRRRLYVALSLQMVALLPQLVGAVRHPEDRWRGVFPALALLALVAALVGARRQKPQLSRLLAYHGLTADGRLREPVSAWADSPMRWRELALLVVITLVFASGIAVALDRTTSPDRCRTPQTAHVQAIDRVVGVPSPVFGVPAPPPVQVRPGLVGVQEVRTGIPDVSYVAGSARAADGTLVGPGVWRVWDPHPFGGDQPLVDAADLVARQITPSIGYSVGSSEDRLLRRARGCARRSA